MFPSRLSFKRSPPSSPEMRRAIAEIELVDIHEAVAEKAAEAELQAYLKANPVDSELEPGHAEEHDWKSAIAAVATVDACEERASVSRKSTSRRSLSSRSIDQIIRFDYQEKTYVRIQKKTDGKNTGTYDGTYVLKEAYDKKDESLEASSYEPGEIFFLKMFPQVKEMLVEGFCEALLGRIITEMIAQSFIDSFYSDCFSPAEAVDIPSVGLVLLQPFIIGAAPLFQMRNESQKRKSVTTEVTNRLLFDQGYDCYLNAIYKTHNFHGLSYIIMIMLLFGNYSLHSGNIMVELTEKGKAEKGEANFKVIDYGAAFRKFIQTWDQTDIWTSLEQNNSLVSSFYFEYKKYLDYYKRIPGLFEAVVKHASNLLDIMQDTEESLLSFQTLIMEAVGDTYDLYENAVIKSHGQEYWNDTARIDLLKYIYGTQYQQFVDQLNDQTRLIQANPEIKHVVYVRQERACSALLENLFSKEVAMPIDKTIQSYLGHHMLEVVFSRLVTLTDQPLEQLRSSSSKSKRLPYYSGRVEDSNVFRSTNRKSTGSSLKGSSSLFSIDPRPASMGSFAKKT